MLQLEPEFCQNPNTSTKPEYTTTILCKFVIAVRHHSLSCRNKYNSMLD